VRVSDGGGFAALDAVDEVNFAGGPLFDFGCPAAVESLQFETAGAATGSLFAGSRHGECRGHAYFAVACFGFAVDVFVAAALGTEPLVWLVRGVFGAAVFAGAVAVRSAVVDSSGPEGSRWGHDLVWW